MRSMEVLRERLPLDRGVKLSDEGVITEAIGYINSLEFEREALKKRMEEMLHLSQKQATVVEHGGKQYRARIETQLGLSSPKHRWCLEINKNGRWEEHLTGPLTSLDRAHQGALMLIESIGNYSNVPLLEDRR